MSGPDSSSYRSHMCGVLRPEHVGMRVRLTGWIQSRREHGQVVFMDLADRTGPVQIVFDAEVSSEAFTAAGELRLGYVVAAEGLVTEREAANPHLDTGRIEVRVDALRLLNRSEPLPFNLDEKVGEAPEDLRLRYRFLDLRRPRYQDILALRHKVLLESRRYLDERGFLEIETPILTKPTPEGARDYLVPSRNFPGSFYALPQSPQIFKQILMVSGCDRYFQIARCFRDEDM
ncbi:MAG: amino acid--tRNA ligase-related protein, partial [Synechococcaceae cyanobacterium]|nr:amino acid--tRNA ligase-related protein [Synechococcaceae cyanobacterium]